MQVFQRQLRRSLQMKMIIANAPLCVLLCIATTYKEQLCTATDQHIANIEIVVYLLGCIVYLTEDILHKIYTENGAITGIWLVLFNVEVRKELRYFQVARRWLAIWVPSNSLIKNLTPFEDDAEIRWLNFLVYLQTSRGRYVYQNGFTQIWFLLWNF